MPRRGGNTRRRFDAFAAGIKELAMRNDGKYSGLPDFDAARRCDFWNYGAHAEHRVTRRNTAEAVASLAIMEFLNLTLVQFLAAFGAIAAISVALYLLDRTRRKQVVSTLRFWVEPGKAAPVTRRPHPATSFLTTAIDRHGSVAARHCGIPVRRAQGGAARSCARAGYLRVDGRFVAEGAHRNDATLMDLARANALAWLRAVPTADRVLVVRADALATPATAWETDRRNVARAILESQPGATALNLSQSLQFASQLQRGSGSVAGEIVYVGPDVSRRMKPTACRCPTCPRFGFLPSTTTLKTAACAA